MRRMARASDAPWLHREVARRLAEHLDPIRLQPARVLDWWAGPGGGAAALRERYPAATIVAVEPDARWAARATGKPAKRWWQTAASRRAETALAGDDDASLAPSQLVWANMVLHAVVDPPALFSRWHGLLDVGGVLAFSCLGPATLAELRGLYAERGWPAPTPGFVDMHDLGDMMVAAGFAEPVLDQETVALTWPDAEAALRELRQIGGNAAPDRFASARGKSWRRQLVDALGSRAGPDGRISLSVEIAYGHGFKPAPRPRKGEPVAVSLDAMREMVREPGRRSGGVG